MMTDIVMNSTKFAFADPVDDSSHSAPDAAPITRVQETIHLVRGVEKRIRISVRL